MSTTAVAPAPVRLPCALAELPMGERVRVRKVLQQTDKVLVSDLVAIVMNVLARKPIEPLQQLQLQISDLKRVIRESTDRHEVMEAERDLSMLVDMIPFARAEGETLESQARRIVAALILVRAVRPIDPEVRVPCEADLLKVDLEALAA